MKTLLQNWADTNLFSALKMSFLSPETFENAANLASNGLETVKTYPKL